MTSELGERRRTPRVVLADRHEFRLGRRIRVRVVDISESGALLSTEERLPIGSRGRLQLSLAGNQFEGQVEVKREQAGEAGAGHLVGLAVAPVQPRHLDVLEQFLRRAGD